MKSISGKKLCRLIEKKGWKLDRIKGSHYIYTHILKDEIIVVPVHSNRDLRVGLKKSIMKIAGIKELEL
jgi:predicted RNA binding protein YcfA (HicA-like mRNA interferase family)